jgi:F420H(2)-dependent quinone reductase
MSPSGNYEMNVALHLSFKGFEYPKYLLSRFDIVTINSSIFSSAAGWSGNTDWYRSLLADPHVTVQVGRRKFAARAEPAPDEEVACYMMDVSRRYPRMDRVWNRWSDQSVDGTFESYLYAAQYFPSVWLKAEESEIK